MKFEIMDDSPRPLRPDPHNKLRSRKALGERSEAIITARLIEIGYNVLHPYGDNLRYDLVIEDATSHPWRVQCKTGHIVKSGSSISFSATSSYAHTRAGKAEQAHRNYQGQIDYFAIYCPATKGVYLVPIDHITGNQGNLRIKPVTGYQKKTVRWAKDYEL